MRYFRLPKSQAGDTIVEVVLAIAVLGLVLGGATVLANRSYRSLQAAQEHGSATRLAQAQLEYIKTYAAENPDQVPTLPAEFCMVDNGGGGYKPVASSDSKCQVDPSGNPTTDLPYTIKLSSQANNGGYNIRAKIQWEGTNNATAAGSIDNVELTYRVYNKVGASSPGGDGNCTTAGYMPNPDPSGVPPCVPVPPQLQVVVKKIAPDPVSNGAVTPSCGKAATQNKGGSSVLLSRVGASPTLKTQTTNGTDSSTTFLDLVQNASYKVDITGVPAGYQLCPPPGSQDFVGHTTRVNSGATFPIIVQVKMRPICYPELRYTAPYAHYTGAYAHYSAPYAHYQLIYWWAHTGPDGYYPTAWYGTGNYVYNGGYSLLQWYNYSGLYPGYSWYNAFTLASGYQYIGTWADYLGTWADYIGTYGDAYWWNTCPS